MTQPSIKLGFPHNPACLSNIWESAQLFLREVLLADVWNYVQRTRSTDNRVSAKLASSATFTVGTCQRNFQIRKLHLIPTEKDTCTIPRVTWPSTSWNISIWSSTFPEQTCSRKSKFYSSDWTAKWNFHAKEISTKPRNYAWGQNSEMKFFPNLNEWCTALPEHLYWSPLIDGMTLIACLAMEQSRLFLGTYPTDGFRISRFRSLIAQCV